MLSRPKVRDVAIFKEVIASKSTKLSTKLNLNILKKASVSRR